MHHPLEKRNAGVDRRRSFRETDRENRFRKIGAGADVNFLAVQKRRLALLRRPELVANRIKYHPENNLAPETQRDRDTKMRDAVEVIHRPIQRIDHPLIIAFLIADDSFFAVKRMLWKMPEQHFGNQILGLHIDLQLDVVCERRVHQLWLLEMRNQQITRSPGRFGGGGEIVHHALNLTESAKLPRNFFRKKTGR